MRAVIIGGVGGMGQGVARDLIKQEQVTKVILADLYPDPERVSPKLRDNEKITLIKMDVNDHDTMVNSFKEELGPWGSPLIFPVSAKTRKGISELLNILL